MILYQVENLKSGRKLKFTLATVNFTWGCECGSDGSFFTEKELKIAEKYMNISYYEDGDGDCRLVDYTVSLNKPIDAKFRKDYEDFCHEYNKLNEKKTFTGGLKKVNKKPKFYREDTEDGIG